MTEEGKLAVRYQTLVLRKFNSKLSSQEQAELERISKRLTELEVQRYLREVKHES